MIKHIVAQGLGYVEVGAAELTHSAVERVREQPREELRLYALSLAISFATGVLIVLLLT
jgi:hypothetical protein